MQAPNEAEALLNSDKGALVTKQALGMEIINAFFKFFRNAESHEPGNQIYVKVFDELVRAVEVWSNNISDKNFSLSLKGDQFFFNEQRIRPKPRMFKKLRYLLRYFRARKIFGFEIPESGISSREKIETFFWALANVGQGKSTLDVIENLKVQGLSDFSIESLNLSADERSGEITSVAQLLYRQLFDFAKRVFQNLELEEMDPPFPLEQTLFELNSLPEEDLVGFLCRGRSQISDFPMADLAVRSTFILHAWGKALGIPPGVVVELSGCALAHPLTYLQPSSTSYRIEALSNDRVLILMSNLERLKRIWPLTDLQVLAVYECMIPFGERGVYELGGRKAYQHFFSRMLRIVVFFQQMITPDRRKASLTPEKAIERLLAEDLGCDRSLLKLFVNWMGIYPVGSLVRLNTGEIAQICSLSSELSVQHRPLVGILTDAAGNPVEKPIVQDLSAMNEKNGVFRQGIREGISELEQPIPEKTFRDLSFALSLATSK